MTPQTEAKANGKLTAPVERAQRKLVALVLFEATRFNHSDTITAKNAGAIEGSQTSIIPARLDTNGDWRPLEGNERLDGFGLEQHRGAGKDRVLYRGFVMLSAVKELVYAE